MQQNNQQIFSATKKIQKNQVSKQETTKQNKGKTTVTVVMNKSSGILKTPAKSILKKSNTKEIQDIEQKQKQQQQQQQVKPTKQQFQKQSSKLTWDEQAIEEHDKTRGQTMRIDEAKTPYTCDQVGSDEEERLELEKAQNNPEFGETLQDVQEQLQLAKKNQLLNQKSNTLDLDEINKRLQQDLSQNKELLLDSDEERENEEEKARKKKAFEEKRKMHYNEAQQMKQMREQIKKQMEEEEQDEDDDDEE